ncbi:MAG: hypothetical protein Q4C04_00140 [Clostridia bacterium]|nr:hypothetical protein [Clostridia bacterium]
MKKIANVFNTVFSIGVIIALFAGGITVLGYIAAMVIGGDTATEICQVILQEYFPWVIKFTSIFIGCGLVGMYLSKKKALTMESNETKNTD